MSNSISGSVGDNKMVLKNSTEKKENFYEKAENSSVA